MVLLFPDQWRADAIGAWGHPVLRTPNVDRLVASSVGFRNHFTVAPLCQPARVSLMTLAYPSRTGTMDNTSPIDPRQRSHVRRIRDEAGYHTALIGKAHITDDVLTRSTDDTLPDLMTWGFSEVIEVPGDRAASHVENPYREWLRTLRVEAGEPTVEQRWLEWFLEYESKNLHYSEWDTTPLSAPPCRMTSPMTPDWFVGETAAEWLRSPPDQPFYLQVNFPGPHPPWNAPDDLEPYDPEDPRLPLGNAQEPGEPWSELVALARRDVIPPSTERERRLTVARYLQRTALVDHAVGLVLDALEETGRLEDTWVFTTSDHGEMLGEKNLIGKVVMFRQSTNVPLLVRPPGGVAGWSSEAWAELVDVGSSILDAIGLEPTPKEVGQSLVDLVLAGPDAAGAHTHRAEVVAECEGFGAVRTADHLLVADEASGEAVEYYDLRIDPEELVNRVQDPASAAVRAELTALLQDRIVG